ncbi:helix-turn-helix domain-containing protein [Iodobacter sp. CM08]|uniref:MarR family winged helix-turn-helix transcriptional regulator n=1 Tax=Iodobacter sp. CM08 TaxID=3085902 RepID=UPI00298224F1|nr:helix-turn-helix domain-containing protein [Iodobacter sp. CM08]MDW5418257.1 helix-turn-helix domain-containing protein [Iodobacter sp. CM08]
MQPQQSNPSAVLTQIMLTIFRVNAQLLEKGDQLVASLGMTSARWQVMGAIALSGQALSCPQIAANMGVSRQGAQKQLNLAQKDGLIVGQLNPQHERSPLYVLTEAGKCRYDKAMIYQALWAKSLVQGAGLEDLETTLNVLSELNISLRATPLPILGMHS